MPWAYKTFEQQADDHGNFVYPNPSTSPDPISYPIGGLLVELSITTSTGCENRHHLGTVTIKKVLNQGERPDEVVIGPLDIPDCPREPITAPINYRVKANRQYLINGLVAGFRPFEIVKGRVGINYSLLAETEQPRLCSPDSAGDECIR